MWMNVSANCSGGLDGENMREMKDSGIEWIGKMPKNWATKRCKYLSTFLNGYAFDSKDLQIDFIYPVIRIGDIKNGTIDTIHCCGVNDNNGLDNYRVLKNDILLAMSGATVGKVGIADKTEYAYINQRVGIIRTKYPKFVYYCLSTKEFIDYIILHANGSAQPNVSGDVYGEYVIPWPNLEKQTEIVSFLDTKCSEIDDLSEDIQKEIETLESYKKSVITEAVTKGLDPDVEMKDSGLQWIGKMPKHWSLIRGKYCLDYLQKPVREDDGVITCFRDGEVTLRSNRREEGFTMSDKEIGYQGLDVGDLVVHGMDGFAGAIGISDSRGKASPVLNVLESYENKKYLMYYLRSMAYSDVFVALATGIRVRSCDLRWNKLAELFYPIPPKKEQDKIVSFIDDKLCQTDKLIAMKQEQLNVLADYKKSLIYEYITGKKEIANEDN